MDYSKEFCVSISILFVSVALSFLAFLYWYSLSFFVGSLFFVHWLSIIATVYIASFVPIYYVLKRVIGLKKNNTLLRFHVFGNLFSFLLISIHFSQNAGRLAQFLSRLEEGSVLFLVLNIIVVTGMIERFVYRNQLLRYTKPIHRYATAFFYLIVIIHAIQNLFII